MKAIVRKAYGGPENLEIADVPVPTVQPGHVLIRVRAFGLNHAELYMRRGEWGAVAAISGIECVGSVVEDIGGQLPAGQTVAALMGGMGRSINGSYAEYVSVPVSNVLPLQTRLSWEVLASYPETYAVAWTCLHRNLQIQAGQRLLVRGGTSSLGQAAIDLAVRHGAQVIATTRQMQRAPHLHALGARQVIAAADAIGSALEPSGGKVDAVLDLTGNSTLLDSMRVTRRGGRVCIAGFLGGMEPLAQFNPLSQMPSGVQLSFFGSFNFGGDEFPLSDVPLQAIIDMIESGQLRGNPARVFAFDEIREAHALMENNAANGKLVVVV
jgi:NADPH:quinone reductase-like Zn-dependent oxidoreductase